MANNTVTLIGNMGSEAKVRKSNATGKEFVVVSLATTERYQDDNEQWQDKETIWHNVVAYSPKVMTVLTSMKKGTRIEVEGSLSYRSFDTNMINEETGEIISKKEASIVAHRVTPAPLAKKSYGEHETETVPSPVE